MNYVIEGLDPAAFQSLFGLPDHELAKRGAIRFEVETTPGYPCRITLEDAEPGETVILLNHISRAGDTPYRASHAIFVREGEVRSASFEGRVPPVFGPRVLSLRGFDESGMMVDARISKPGDADLDIRTLFENPRIVEIDIHNAARGCFSARARGAQ